MAITFDKINRIITIDPNTSVTIQVLINAIRDWQDELPNMEIANLASASGKEDLGGGTLVGVTLKLMNWKLKFADKASATVCTVRGGNLVAVDANGDSMDAIEPSVNTTIVLAQSTSATVIAAEAEWAQTEKDQIFADVDKVESDVADVRTDLDLVKHKGISGETYEREKESLEAIRERGDEAWTTGKVSRGFRI